MKVTGNVTNPESPERKPLEASSSSLSEALGTEVKQESTEMPVERNEGEPRSDQVDEKTEVEPSGNHVEEETASTNQREVKEVDRDEDKVMRHFSTTMSNCLSVHCEAKTVKLRIFLSHNCSAGGRSS